jgi:hypothetical protein
MNDDWMDDLFWDEYPGIDMGFEYEPSDATYVNYNDQPIDIITARNDLVDVGGMRLPGQSLPSRLMEYVLAKPERSLIAGVIIIVLVGGLGRVRL